MTAPAHRRPHPATRLLGAAIAVLFALPLPATCQTNPIPQIPPYSQDFGTAPFNTLPPGLAAWGGLSGGSVSSVTAASASGPTADSTVATASAAQTTGGSYGLGSGGNGRFYIQTSSNTANGANQLALALDTTGQTGITLSYDVESVSANLRTIGAVCQWRAGTSGTWATVTPETGLNPCSQSGGSPGPITSVDATLPSGADNKPVVQVRWAVWRGTEAGNSSGLAIDNITVAATSISGTLSISVDPSSVIESAGANAATVTVTTAAPVDADLPVTLTSSDTTEAVVGSPVVVIHSGGNTATFTINAVDDDLNDGSQTVTLRASAAGAVPVAATLTVNDDEDPYSAPPGYYSEAGGLTGAQLKAALKTIAARGHVQLAYADTLNPVRALHEDGSNSANIITIYSGTSVGRNDVYRPNAQLDPSRNWSREHCWPGSYGLDPDGVNPGATNGDAGPDYTDLHNLRPSLQTVNTQRGNRLYDETTGGGTAPALAPACSYDADSWEPRPEEKGDLARAILYMATRYDGTDPGTIDLEASDQPSATAGRFGKLSALLQWHQLDPVSTGERKRNHLVWSDWQHNRNPFVDHPEYVAMVWGGVRADRTEATVTEGGAGDSYSISLASQPTANVTVTVSTSPAGQVTATPSVLVFTPANWSAAQNVSLSAVNDSVYEATSMAAVIHAITSGDARYATLTLPDLAVTVIDDDPVIAPATLPLAYGGPWNPLPSPGFMGTGIGTYASSLGGDTGTGSVRFDDTGDRLTVAFGGGPPGQLGYRLKGQPGSGTSITGTFVVEESPDGDVWSPVRTVTDKSNVDEAFTDTLSPATRFVSFTYQEKVAGNLQLDALTIGTATGWQAWLDANSLTGAAADPGGDPDHDGVPNLAEYAMALSPTTAGTSGVPRAGLQAGHLTFTYRLNKTATDLTVTPETSTTLAAGSWTSSGLVETSRADKGGHWLVTVTCNAPVASQPVRFVRLRITQP